MLSPQSFLRKGVSLGCVGLNWKLEDLKDVLPESHVQILDMTGLYVQIRWTAVRVWSLPSWTCASSSSCHRCRGGGGVRVQGSGFRVYDLGFRVQGVGFGV
jgi:hypothetical protein